MIRLVLILFLFTLGFSCNDRDRPALKMDHPELRSLNNLPKKVRIVGTVRELRPGLCGVFCKGGYINFNFNFIYAITACLELGVKTGVKVDIIATLHTGKETECYYEHFDKPKDSEQYVFYQLSETETAKVHN